MKTKIKICGLFRDEDADYTNAAIPDYAGFVFAKSRRQIDISTAERMRSMLDERILTVGVFVNAADAEIEEACKRGCISIIQLHGNETNDDIRRLKASTGCEVIKAVDMNKPENMALYAAADYLLFDNGAGGTGESFDWRQIPAAATPIFLAGGINLDNIAKAATLNTYALDVSSGAETNGLKDLDKMIALVRAVRGIE